MATLANALRAVGVPVVASVDMDILNDERALRGLVEAVGGDWAAVADDYAKATADFRTPRRPRLAREVQAVVDANLNRDPEAPYTTELRRQVTEALAAESP